MNLALPVFLCAALLASPWLILRLLKRSGRTARVVLIWVLYPVAVFALTPLIVPLFTAYFDQAGRSTWVDDLFRTFSGLLLFCIPCYLSAFMGATLPGPWIGAGIGWILTPILIGMVDGTGGFRSFSDRSNTHPMDILPIQLSGVFTGMLSALASLPLRKYLCGHDKTAETKTKA